MTEKLSAFDLETFMSKLVDALPKARRGCDNNRARLLGQHLAYRQTADKRSDAKGR